MTGSSGSARPAGWRLAATATALLLGPACSALWGQQRLSPEQVPPAWKGLEKLGDLRLRTYSIHGVAPLVMLMTEAPPWASEAERSYRHRFTEKLIWNIDRLPVSLYSLRGDAGSAFETFRGLRPVERPQVIIGFGEGALTAARLLLRDSLPGALVALMPSFPRNTEATEPVEVWREFLRATARPRPVLVLESPCNANRWITDVVNDRQTVLLLPQFDGWFSRRTSSACPATPPVSAAGMDYELAAMLTEWLRRTVSFPQ